MKWMTCVVAVLALLAVEVGEPMALEYIVRPVGKVVKKQKHVILDILPSYQEALLGLDGFSHVIVLYWFDRNDNPEKRSILRVHPRADRRNPLTGVFATRSPARPNLIGLEVCRIESVKGNQIFVDRIDAFDKTPILDLKPYIPRNDCVEGAVVPSWVGTRNDP